MVSRPQLGKLVKFTSMRAGAATLALALAATASGGAIASAPSAGDGPTAGDAQPARGGWAQVSSGQVDMLSEITATRTPDGSLHAVYRLDTGVTQAYQHARLATSGAVQARNDVFGSWTGVVDNPVLAKAPGGGLRLVFSGLQDTVTANFFSTGYAYEARSDDSGAAWAVQPRALTRSSVAYAGYGTGAVTLPDGTPVTAWQLNSDIGFRVGSIESTDQTVVNAQPSDQTFAIDSCCGYDLDLVQAGGAVWLAWYANGSGASANGTFVRQIYPTVGPILKAPDSSVGDSSSAADQRVAMTARPDGSVVMAYAVGYPTARRIAVWQVGTTRPAMIPARGGVDLVSLDAGPSGRMWLAWTDESDRVHAARSSATGLQFGAVTELGAPTRSEPIFAVTVDASLSQGTALVQSDGSVFSQQVAPGLSLAASPRALRSSRPGKVKFRVTDAGDAVAGAKVTVAGRSCKTSASGRCTLTVPGRPAGTLRALARKSGYGAAVVVLKVRR